MGSPGVALLGGAQGIAGRGLFPDPTDSALGAGGARFVIRSIAEARRSQVLRFAYPRPWETVPPEDEGPFTIDVFWTAGKDGGGKVRRGDGLPIVAP